MLNLEQERLKHKWTLDYVAQMLDTTKSTVCDMEKERCKPSYEKLVKLEDLYQKPYRWLFSVADDSTTPLPQ